MLSTEDLSLLGLFARLTDVERRKEFAKPSEEDLSLIATEPAVKKLIAERLGAIGDKGLTAAEKSRSKSFLESQLKAVEPGTKAAEARTQKLRELLEAVEKSASAEEPAHVRKARDAVKRAEKEYDAVHKQYDKWDKGKQILDIDQIKVLKRTHDDLAKHYEASKAYLADQLARRPEAAGSGPPRLPTATTAALANESGKAKHAPGAVRGGGPAVRVSQAGRGAGGRAPVAAAAVGGYPSAGRGSSAAWVVPEVQDPEPAPALPAKPRPPPKPKNEEPALVLSFACVCKAVSEHLGVKEKQVHDMGSSTAEIQQHFDRQTWDDIAQRSVAIEKEEREKKKNAEKKKAAAALAKITEKQGHVSSASAPAVSVPGAAAPSSKASGVQAKPKAKPAPMPKKAGNLAGLAQSNRFGGFEDDDDDDEGGGWTKVR